MVCWSSCTIPPFKAVLQLALTLTTFLQWLSSGTFTLLPFPESQTKFTTPFHPFTFVAGLYTSSYHCFISQCLYERGKAPQTARLSVGGGAMQCLDPPHVPRYLYQFHEHSFPSWKHREHGWENLSAGASYASVGSSVVFEFWQRTLPLSEDKRLCYKDIERIYNQMVKVSPKYNLHSSRASWAAPP